MQSPAPPKDKGWLRVSLRNSDAAVSITFFPATKVYQLKCELAKWPPLVQAMVAAGAPQDTAELGRRAPELISILHGPPGSMAQNELVDAVEMGSTGVASGDTIFVQARPALSPLLRAGVVPAAPAAPMVNSSGLLPMGGLQ
jgi:hypothetical protein